jgi:hypothetical protein
MVRNGGNARDNVNPTPLLFLAPPLLSVIFQMNFETSKLRRSLTLQ